MIGHKDFYGEFKKCLNIEWLGRESNRIADGVYRKDFLFDLLVRLYLDNQKKFKQLYGLNRKYIKNKKNPDELDCALMAYFAYINEDFKLSKKFLLKAINLSPENIDNWLDLGFVLRHLGEEELSYGIFFNYDLIIHYYRKLCWGSVGFGAVKKLIFLIKEKTNS